MTKLNENEYALYYKPYIKPILNNKKSLLDNLNDTLKTSIDLLENLPGEKYDYAYAEGKWTIKEIIQHLIDAERVMAYRALRFARRDNTELPGFDENDYVIHSNGNQRSVSELQEEIKLIRKSTIIMFKSFNETDLKHIGIANGSQVSVRALGYIIAGHQLHHMKIIKERYL